MLLTFILIKFCEIFLLSSKTLHHPRLLSNWSTSFFYWRDTRSSKIRFKVQGSRYFVNYFDVRILKWYVGKDHIPYFMYTGIYPRTKLKIVRLPHNMGKYADKMFRLNGSHRFLCTRNPILYLLMKLKNFLQKKFAPDKTLYNESTICTVYHYEKNKR